MVEEKANCSAFRSRILACSMCEVHRENVLVAIDISGLVCILRIS